MTAQLLQRLSADHYTSGEHLASLHHCTRAAISKQIEQLRAQGVLISSRSRLGYRLDYPYRWWSDADASALACSLPLQATCLPVVDSTSDWLRRLPASPGLHLAFTDFQRGGKGRRGREWLSPPGRQLTFSLRCHSEQSPMRWLGVAMALGVRLAEVLIAQGWPVRLKWPNDIMLGSAKLAGILVEMDALAEGPCDVIVGVGLNEMLLPGERAHLARPVSALQDEAVSYDRFTLLADILRGLAEVLEHYPEQGLEGFREAWSCLDCLQGQSVRFEQGGRLHEGCAQGIDAQGSLLVQTPEGLVRCHSGEVNWA